MDNMACHLIYKKFVLPLNRSSQKQPPLQRIVLCFVEYDLLAWHFDRKSNGLGTTQAQRSNTTL